MTSRAQTESIGVILLTAVIVVTVGTAGTIVLADTGSDDTTQVDLSTDITDEGVAVVHNGGESIPFDSLKVVVRHGDESWRPAVNDSGIVRGDADGQLDSGDRWVWRQSLDSGEVTKVQVFDRRTNTLLAEARRYPTSRKSLTPTGGPVNDTTPPTVAVDEPNGGEALGGGTTTTVEWSASDAETRVAGVNIEYSTDDGATWTTVVTDTRDDGQYQWSVPRVNTTEALVRITAVDAEGNTANDTSDAVFTIDSTAPTVTVDDPNGGESFDAGSTRTIEWSASDANGVDGIDIEYSTDNGTTWSPIVTDTADDGAYDWTVANVDTANALVRVTATDGAGYVAGDTSDATFSISGGPPTVTVDAPNGGETLKGGSTATVQWRASDTDGVASIRIEYTTDGGTNWNTIVADTADDGGYTWNVSTVDTTNALVRVTATDTNGDSASDTSDAAFTIDSTPPGISQYAVTNPSGYQVTVTFEADERLGNIDVGLTRKGTRVTNLTETDFNESGSGPYTYSADYVVSEKGDYTATLNLAADAAGNDGSSGESGTVKIKGSGSGIPVIQNFSGFTASSDGDFVEVGNVTVEEFSQGNNVGIGSVTIEVREAGSKPVLRSTTIKGGEKTSRISRNGVRVDASIDKGTSYNVTVVATSTDGDSTSQSETVAGEETLAAGRPVINEYDDILVTKNAREVTVGSLNASDDAEITKVEFTVYDSSGTDIGTRTYNNISSKNVNLSSVKISTFELSNKNDYRVEVRVYDSDGNVATRSKTKTAN